MSTKAIAFIALVFMSSCNWFCPPKPTGTLFGTALMSNPPATITDQSGITVTATTDDGEISASTDMKGLWQLNNVPTGTYVLSYTKAGYGTYKMPGFVFSAPGKTRIPNTTVISALPQYDVSSISVTVQTGQVTVNGTLSGASSGYRALMLFFGQSQTISSSVSEYICYYQVGTNNSSTFSQVVPFTYIRNYGAPAGATMYVTAYSCSNNNYYTDVETGKQVFYNQSPNHSNVATFVVQ
jgi:hypothetical protein